MYWMLQGVYEVVLYVYPSIQGKISSFDCTQSIPLIVDDLHYSKSKNSNPDLPPGQTFWACR